jgi:4-amino-4-deoxy-L-arabinose transferase-like glycosyltransferase
VIMTPDTPLLLFWTATLWAGARLASGGGPGWWLAAGLFSGLALLSKYTGVFLPFGLLLFAGIAMPRALLRPLPWLGGLIAGLLFLPVVLWNAQHDWIGLLRQGGRVADWQPARAVQFLAELLGGQIAIATPGVFVLLTAGIVVAVRLAWRSRGPQWTLLAALSVPPVLVFVQHAIGDRVQGNWPAIICPAAAVAASGLTAPVWRRWIWPSCGLGFAMTAALYALVVTGWPIPVGRAPVARQLFGWNDLAAGAMAARQAAGADYIVAEPYGLAAELSWALPHPEVIAGIGAHWLPTTLPRAAGSEPGILIRPERYGPPDPVQWPGAVPLTVLVRDADIERYAVFLVQGSDRQTAMVLLPHR